MQATDGPKNMKDVIQRKFLDDIIGDANSKHQLIIHVGGKIKY